MSTEEVQREFDSLKSILDKAMDYENAHNVDSNFHGIVDILRNAKDEMKRMINEASYRSSFNFDSWFQMNVFYALDELRDYISF